MSEFLSRLGGAAASGAAPGPLSQIMDGLMGGRQDASGLSSMLDRLRQGGLGPQVESWVGPGENQAVDPQALETALGPQAVQQIAQQSGVPQQGMMGVLAMLLPLLVDRLTPQGRLPQSDSEMPQGGIGGMLGGLLGHLGGGGVPGSAGGLTDLLGSLLGGRGAGR